MTVPNLRSWLVDGALPLWASAGLDREQGGFFERLDADGRPMLAEPKRVVVQFRQIYVFSHAAILTGDERWLDIARHGLDFVRAHAWHPTTGGWMHLLARDGTPLDARRDAYDQAFALYALGWHAKASGDASALDEARRTMAWMDGHLADPVAGGYAEALDDVVPDRGWRRQNPHMHLFEALVALHELTGERDWLDRAARIHRMLASQFLQADGTLAEFFTEDWAPAPSEPGTSREAGHHFEWCWLLDRWGRAAGDPGIAALSDPLWAWALDHGVETDSALVYAPFDENGAEGTIRRGSKRLWPQTEFIKAAVVREEAGDRDAAALVDRQLDSLFTHYLSGPPGLWRDQLQRDGSPLSTNSPASSFYHLYLCLIEVLRVRGL
jgi:mannose/cellobiose epimerase-like protein (N-acyl-D-glucosamine 2-epimerase family)